MIRLSPAWSLRGWSFGGQCHLRRIPIRRRQGFSTRARCNRLWAVSESLLRREAVENAVADLRLEGLAPTADAVLIFEQFVQGELTEEQLVNAVLAR
jgi:Antitoxin VbhA